ncbi:histidine kinase N-terminal 7TM domain-containing protein [Methanolobus chelungpuianus]|uniref:histidine kinase N-terminal 7TM domain-containing protein n=1 Tax=Methanolobus chelungpuianus TaxID=502115 RepID=UPI002114C3D7|nr:histidine kinase N-terminal 7TM domain-containing protein [Methanolobus chelungpuianus]
MYFNIYTIPLIASVFALCLLAFYIQKIKTTPGVRYFSLLLLSTAFYSLFYALEISSYDLQTVLVFYKLEYIGVSTIPFFFLLFAINYTGKKQWSSNSLIAAFMIVPLTTFLLVFTTEYHDLFHKNFYIANEGLFPVAVYEPGIWFWVQNAYTITCIVLGVNLLFGMLLGASPALRKQVSIVLLGSIIPFMTFLLYLAGMKPWGIDPAPFSMTLSGFIIYVGFTRYKLFDFAPMARSLLFDNIPDSVIVLDMEGRIVDCNHTALKHLRIKTEDMGKRVSELPAPWVGLLTEGSETGMKDSREVKMTIEDSTFWLSVTSLPLNDKYRGITGYMVIISNITARKTAEEELLEKNRLLKEATDHANHMASQAEMANSAKSQFLAVMSHEMRTPLNGIIGFTDLLMETELTEAQMQHMKAVYTSATSLLDLINDVLDFSKIEADKLELDTERIDLTEICEQVADIVKCRAHEKGLELLLNISPEMPRYVIADRLRLKQVLVNLLGNAVKFTETGEIELRIEAMPVTDTGLADFTFSVRDTGIGIARENLSRIFNSFSQADGSITRRYGGTGLGLTISNRLLEKMGSRLELESEPAKGSTFRFTVSFEAEEGEQFVGYDLSGIRRVLVVDDNITSRSILERLLRSAGIKVDLAGNGAEALCMADEHDYDLFIVDYDMPLMNGLDLVRAFRDKSAFSRDMGSFIVMHNLPDSSLVHNGCKELGIRSVITKPVRITEFFRTLAHVRSTEETFLTAGTETRPERPEGEPCDKYTILLAEDNEINMILASTIISGLFPQARLIKATDGQQTVRAFKDTGPDMVFMDIQMPELSGYDASRAIRKIEADTGGNDRRVPIIALTAGTVKGEKERCMEAGMDDYITKPVIAGTIRDILHKWLPTCDYRPGLPEGDSNSDCDRFNKEQLLSNIGGDLQMFNSLISTAMAAFNQNLADIRAAYKVNDMQDLKRRAHKLKGSALNIGCNMLAEIASKVEDAAEKNDMAVEMLLQEMSNEIALIREDICAD